MPPLIYLDHHSTTPCDPEVLDAMMPYFTERFGNAASRTHQLGWEAEEAVDIAREQVAKLLGCSPAEIIFTSGATESDNLAILGAARARANTGRHIITVTTEHKAVLDACHALEQEGFEVSYLKVGKDGLIDPEQLERTLRPDTILISMMHANNEIGVIQPIDEAARVCKSRNILFHSDGAQAVGKMPVNVRETGLDLYAISGHKIYGPKGIGALYVRRRDPRVILKPLQFGGGHERGFRSGTLPVPLIVGLGKACEILQKNLVHEVKHLRELRDALWKGIEAQLPNAQVNGSMSHRIPNNLNVSFPGINGEALLMGLTGIAVSTGSACTSASIEASYVLKALNVSDKLAHASLRFGVGRFNTMSEIEIAIAAVAKTVHRLGKMR